VRSVVEEVAQRPSRDAATRGWDRGQTQHRVARSRDGAGAPPRPPRVRCGGL